MSGAEIDRLIQLLAKLPGLGPRSARRAVLYMLKRRDAFDEAMNRELEAEQGRQAAADARIGAMTDAKAASKARADEVDRHGAWSAAQAKNRRDEASRRRKFELERRQRQAAEANAEAALRTREDQQRSNAAAADQAANDAVATAAGKG